MRVSHTIWQQPIVLPPALERVLTVVLTSALLVALVGVIQLAVALALAVARVDVTQLAVVLVLVILVPHLVALLRERAPVHVQQRAPILVTQITATTRAPTSVLERALVLIAVALV